MFVRRCRRHVVWVRRAWWINYMIVMQNCARLRLLAFAYLLSDLRWQWLPVVSWLELARGWQFFPKFCSVGKSSSFWKILVQKCKICCWKPSFREILGAELKFCAHIIFAVSNLQLSVGILSEICNACRKTANFCFAYFLNLRCVNAAFECYS